jgi:hypothetical protein
MEKFENQLELVSCEHIGKAENILWRACLSVKCNGQVSDDVCIEQASNFKLT